jgi:hypothetical protein
VLVAARVAAEVPEMKTSVTRNSSLQRPEVTNIPE